MRDLDPRPEVDALDASQCYKASDQGCANLPLTDTT